MGERSYCTKKTVNLFSFERERRAAILIKGESEASDGTVMKKFLLRLSEDERMRLEVP